MGNLYTPIALPMSAFDAKTNEKQVFRFVSKGGSQVVKNRLIIKNDETREVVYDKTIESYKFEHIIIPNSFTIPLVNGNTYNFVFITYDIDGHSSEQSNIIKFKCYTTPTVIVKNIPIDGIIRGNSFNLDILYNQDEGELIDFAKVILYDEFNNEIFKSKNIYNESIPPISFQYEIKGLKDSKTYYLKVLVNTIENTLIESRKYTLITEYFTPSFESLIELKNNCNEGCVEINNNFVVIDSNSYPLNIQNFPEYFHDGKIELIEQGTFLEWEKGFNIPKNFYLKFLVENPNIGNLITIGEGNKKIEISLEYGYPYLENTKKYFITLKSYFNSLNSYSIYSNYFRDKTQLIIHIKRIDGLFDLEVNTINEDKNKTKIYWNKNTQIYYNKPTNLYWEE